VRFGKTRARVFTPALPYVLDVPIGTVLVLPLPAGQYGTIQVQRNDVDIPGAVSAPGSAYILYTVVAEDQGKKLTVRVVDEGVDTSPPMWWGMNIFIAEPDTVVIEYHKWLGTNALEPSQFVLSGTVATPKTPLSATYVANKVKVKFDSNFVPGDEPQLAYTQGVDNALRVKDYAGNLAASFTALPVWNDFPVPATLAVVLTTGTSSTNMVAGGGGYVKSNTNGGPYSGIPTMPSWPTRFSIMHQAGWLEMQVSDANAAVRTISLKSATLGNDAIASMPYQIRHSLGAATAYVDGVAVGTPYTFATPSALCRARLFRDIPSGEVTFDTSEDGGISWTTRYTFVTATPSDDSLLAYFHSNSTTVAIIGTAMQGFTDRGYG
jgi:hypothetical protein